MARFVTCPLTFGREGTWLNADARFYAQQAEPDSAGSKAVNAAGEPPLQMPDAHVVAGESNVYLKDLHADFLP